MPSRVSVNQVEVLFPLHFASLWWPDLAGIGKDKKGTHPNTVVAKPKGQYVKEAANRKELKKSAN
jgi:hypothetical protein